MIQIFDEYRPYDAAMTFNSGDRESSSNAGDSLVSFNLISPEEAERIYKRLESNAVQNTSTKRNWSHDEVKMLEFAVDWFCQSSGKSINNLATKDWNEIALRVPGRTESQCLYKWKKRTKQKAFTKTTWTTYEDQILISIVNQFGPKNWQTLANILNQKLGEPDKRVGKQCRERWLNHLHPSINKQPWSASEDLILLEKHKKYPNQWARIAKDLPGRTENMVKNRYNIVLRNKEKSRNSEFGSTSGIFKKSNHSKYLTNAPNKASHGFSLEKQNVNHRLNTNDSNSSFGKFNFQKSNTLTDMKRTLEETKLPVSPKPKIEPKTTVQSARLESEKTAVKSKA